MWEKTSIRGCLILIAAFVLTVTGCSYKERHTHHHRQGPPAHAPAHGHRNKHTYHYYPDSCVYYDSNRGVYFYLHGSNWVMAARLPGHYHLDSSASVTIALDTDTPYTYYHVHKNKYPPGQAKKHHRKAHGPPHKPVQKAKGKGKCGDEHSK